VVDRRARHAFTLVGAIAAGAVIGVAAQPTNSCAPIDGIDSVLALKTVTLFGEVHGTNEVPAFVANVLCHATARHLRVTLGVELPRESTAALERYVKSAGTADDRTRLLADAAWHMTPPDGRTSEAMLRLIDSTRQFVAEGGDVDVLAFSDTASSGLERDALMAEILATKITADPRRVTLVLTGNLHSRSDAWETYDAYARRSVYRPMGYLLRERLTGMKVLGLNVSYDEGAAWMCLSGVPPESACGAHAVKAQRQVAVNTIELTHANRYEGFFGVGALTASKPAVQ
jgi:hypothetical protein